MSVSPHPKDFAGTAKQAEVTALQATQAVVTSTPAKNAVDVKLRQTQSELVVHYMNIGRIDPATILSTLS